MTATEIETPTRPLIGLEELPDLDPSLNCDICSELTETGPAEIGYRFLCCGRRGNLCRPHADQLLQVWERNIVTYAWNRCRYCLARWTPPILGHMVARWEL